MLVINVKNWPCAFNELGTGDAPVEGCFAGAVVTDNMFKRRMGEALRNAVVGMKECSMNNIGDVLVSFDGGHNPPVSDFFPNRTLLIEVWGLSGTDLARLTCKLMLAASNLVPLGWMVGHGAL